MTDQPAFKARDFGFRMKLKGEHRRPPDKGLVGAKCGRGQPLRAFGEIEDIAMPMQQNRLRRPMM